MELWKPVLGFEQLYEVSSCGRVRRIAKGGAARVGHVLRPAKDKQGYIRINLCHNSVAYPKKMHRLVAEAFFGAIPEKLTVNHKNGDKADNRVDNLEVVSRGANILHALRVIKTRCFAGERNPRSTLTEADVLEIRRRLAAGERNVDLAAMFKTNKQVISHIKVRRTWSHI